MQQRQPHIESFIAEVRAAEFVRDMRDLCERVWISNYLNKFYRSSATQDAFIKSHQGESKMLNNIVLPLDYAIRTNPWRIANTKVSEIKDKFKNLPIPVTPSDEDIFNNAWDELVAIIPESMNQIYENALRWAIAMQKEVKNAYRH